MFTTRPRTTHFAEKAKTMQFGMGPHTTQVVGGKCSVCMDNVIRLTKLDCQHTFCKKCENHQKLRVDTMTELKQPITIECPYCREFFQAGREKKKVDAFRRPLSTNGYERQGVKHERSLQKRCQPCLEGHEYTDATYWCEDCAEYFCSTCSRYHLSMKMSKAHRMRTERLENKPKYEIMAKSKYEWNVPVTKQTAMKASKNDHMRPINIVYLNVGEYDKDEKCSKHYNELLSLFCKLCQTSCCTICAIASHSDCKSKSKDKKDKQRDDGSRSWEFIGGKSKSKDKKDKQRDDGHRSWEFIGGAKSKDLSPGFGLYRDGKTKTDREREYLYDMGQKESKKDKFYDKREKEYKAKDKGKSPVGVHKLRMDHRKSRLGIGSAATDDWVISMAMLPSGDILIITLYGSDLKLIDQGGNVISTCTFYGDPWSVAAYHDCLAAVTFSDRNQIQLVNINRGVLQPGKKITTKQKPLAVCFANNLIAFSTWEGSVHLMDITGSEICSILTDHRGERLFSNPEYIASNKAGNVVYVSDYKRNSVTALKLQSTRFEKKPMFVFTDKELKGPKGVAVDDDDIIYVSGMTSRNIFRVFPTGERIQMFGRREDVEYYEDICVSRDSDKLFVSAYEEDSILVFNLNKV